MSPTLVCIVVTLSSEIFKEFPHLCSPKRLRRSPLYFLTLFSSEAVHHFKGYKYRLSPHL